MVEIRSSKFNVASWIPLGLCILLFGTGCQSSRPQQAGSVRVRDSSVASAEALQRRNRFAADAPSPAINLVSHEDSPDPTESAAGISTSNPEPIESQLVAIEDLSDLESLALDTNPTLRRMQHEAAAAWDKTQYIAKLPDPTVGSMFFQRPMNFDPDRQVADIQVMQMIPWLNRLKAAAQRACTEAMAAENDYHAERLRIIGELRANWYKLYVLDKQLETTVADQAQLESLIRTANARVSTGAAQPGDVLMATLELSSLQEQLISYRQQIVATTAELNRLLGRDATHPIQAPKSVSPEFPDWDLDSLRQLALDSQPEMNAARLRTAASRWGIEVARLQRRPDLSFGVGWVFMDAPGSTMPGAGRDSLTLGVSTTLPIWQGKYRAMVSEASREHFAAHASEAEVANRLDALLRDLWEQARASHETLELYEKSILPQARQTFEADQKSLINNTVSFDRVIRDYRTLLNLELGYHRALGQQATALARIRQTIGTDLVNLQLESSPQPEE